MYDFKSRVRYSEVNSERQLTLPALIDYLQNCCTFQSEDMNIGVEYLEQHHAAWVLSSWEIVMNRYPKLAEHITVSTWPYSFKGFYGYRNFTIKDEAGEICAFANSVWVYMDTATMRPVRIAKEVQDAYIPVILQQQHTQTFARYSQMLRAFIQPTQERSKTQRSSIQFLMMKCLSLHADVPRPGSRPRAAHLLEGLHS